MFLPGGPRPNGSNSRQREQRRRRKEEEGGGRRSETDLIHKFDFTIRDEANRK